MPTRGLLDIVREVQREELGLSTRRDVSPTSVEELVAFMLDILKERLPQILQEAAESAAINAINLAAFKFAHMLRLLLTDDEIQRLFSSLPSLQARAALRTAVSELWREALKDYAKMVAERLGGRHADSLVLNLIVEKIFEKLRKSRKGKEGERCGKR